MEKKPFQCIFSFFGEIPFIVKVRSLDSNVSSHVISKVKCECFKCVILKEKLVAFRCDLLGEAFCLHSNEVLPEASRSGRGAKKQRPRIMNTLITCVITPPLVSPLVSNNRAGLEVKNARDKQNYNSYQKTQNTKVLEDVLLRGYHFVWWKMVEN